MKKLLVLAASILSFAFAAYAGTATLTVSTESSVNPFCCAAPGPGDIQECSIVVIDRATLETLAEEPMSGYYEPFNITVPVSYLDSTHTAWIIPTCPHGGLMFTYSTFYVFPNTMGLVDSAEYGTTFYTYWNTQP